MRVSNVLSSEHNARLITRIVRKSYQTATKHVRIRLMLKFEDNEKIYRQPQSWRRPCLLAIVRRHILRWLARPSPVRRITWYMFPYCVFTCILSLCLSYCPVGRINVFIYRNLREFRLRSSTSVLFLFQLDLERVHVCLLLKHVPHHSSPT